MITAFLVFNNAAIMHFPGGRGPAAGTAVTGKP
jgi:hypothetical protein